MTMNRREFIKMSGACAGAAATLSMPGVSFAGPINDKKIVLIHLDGGVDGWGMMTPVYGDPLYKTFRGPFAVPAPNDMSVDASKRSFYMSDLFGMHPYMPELYGMFSRGEATCFMNVTLTREPWNGTSHFNEQRRPRNGLDINSEATVTGWLNRLLTAMSGENTPGGISVTGTPTLSDALRGPEPAAIYMPPGMTMGDATIARLRQTMGSKALRQVLDAGLQKRAALNASLNGSNINLANYTNYWGFTTQAQVVGTILGSDPKTAPSVASMVVPGWDMHTMENNGWGFPAARFAHLSQGLGILVDTLKRYNIFHKTMIVLVSEFGRAAAHNGVGVDHGNGQTGVIITGNPLLMAQPGKGVVLKGAWKGIDAKNAYGLVPYSDNYMNIIREYVASHFEMTTAEKDFVLPYVTPA